MKVKLTENQFQRIAPHYDTLNRLNTEISLLNKMVEDIASLILESNKIELKQGMRYRIDFNTKELILDEKT
jgi:hypothetical protein